MKADPLEEMWAIKDQLAAEAGYDLKRICEQLRGWPQSHQRTGPLIQNAEELRKWMEQKQAEKADGLALSEEPPGKSNS
jgi:hypothetical protein